MDGAERALLEKEREMVSIIESADLFEVTVPDFKQLKACRKELKILKVAFLCTFMQRQTSSLGGENYYCVQYKVSPIKPNLSRLVNEIKVLAGRTCK